MRNLEDITILDYTKMLRGGQDVKDIEAELSKSLGSLGGGVDLHLFMLQKDLLIFQCKMAKAYLEEISYIEDVRLQKIWFNYYGFHYTFDEVDRKYLLEIDFKIIFCNRKIKQLREEIEKKTAKKETVSPYKSFLSWVLAVEKYLGFSIDRNNDLLYLSEATRQMLNFYDQQKKQIDEQNAKRK